MFKSYSGWVLENFNSNRNLCHTDTKLLVIEIGNSDFKTWKFKAMQKFSKVLNFFSKINGKINTTNMKANN
jgi:hypothetical protein